MDKHYTLVSCPYCHLVYSKDGHYDNMERGDCRYYDWESQRLVNTVHFAVRKKS